MRDMEGTRAAGFGMFILYYEPKTQEKEPPNNVDKPDYTIRDMMELLDIFPDRKAG
jgi:FMN phosphatase YigB (HAD superfamily)